MWPVSGEAPREWLCDPAVLCLECGGSGRTDLGNFDHHGDGGPLPPACVQALQRVGGVEAWLDDLVAYTAAVDEGRPPSRARALPDLSHVVSGARLVHPDLAGAFRAALRVVAGWRGLPPWGPVAPRPEWQPYLWAKRGNQEALLADLDAARFVTTRAGRRIGFVITPAAGGHEALRRLGADVSMLAMHLEGGRYKYTVASRTLRVDGYLPRLRLLEPGWGGPHHGTIIGSPFEGSRLTPDQLLALLLDDSPLRTADPPPA